MMIYSDASSEQGWGAHLAEGPLTGGSWTKEEKSVYHINELKLIAAELALKTFVRFRTLNLIHLFMDNMTALHYLFRKGVTKSPHLTTISKRIWGFLEFKWDYTYCLLDPVKEKHDSRVEITSKNKFQRMQFEPQSFSQNCISFGTYPRWTILPQEL